MHMGLNCCMKFFSLSFSKDIFHNPLSFFVAQLMIQESFDLNTTLSNRIIASSKTKVVQPFESHQSK
ncbi:uncharacterized protein DS421_2g56010 [Arachis hypogaea]|nr:uncharacterized protein DS421_2g56010 [Arachis hypogaea]